MKCDACGANLMIAKSKFESDIGTTNVYNVLTMVCINPKCDNYCGSDLSQPLKITAEIRDKVN
jgi:hypothetical protein